MCGGASRPGEGFMVAASLRTNNASPTMWKLSNFLSVLVRFFNNYRTILISHVLFGGKTFSF